MSNYARESNNDDLTNTALAVDMYGLSNRAVAAVINGFRLDIGLSFARQNTAVGLPEECLERAISGETKHSGDTRPAA